jgi:hypothetical protein
MIMKRSAVCFIMLVLLCSALPVSAAFIDNADGTITDTATGLMWQQATAPGTYTWQQALDYIALLNAEEYLGYDDWRLPDRTELQSIVDYGRFDPAIDPLFSAVASYYWSSTTGANGTYYAWVVYFYNGYVGYGSKANNYYVRAVRSGQYVLLGDLGYLCIEDYHCDEGEECVEGVCEVPSECETDEDCEDGEVCVDGECQPEADDDPPALGDGPFVAGGWWPVLSDAQESPTYLSQNVGLLWTFSDDFASCPDGDCTHTAEYSVAGSGSWTPVDVIDDPFVGSYPYVALPIDQLANATTYAFRFTVTDCAAQTTESGTFYFRVATGDAPPVIVDGPFLAAGPWPVFPIGASQAFMLNQNYDVYWTISDDYASCGGLCTHLFRYRKMGDEQWSTLPVSTNPEGDWYAYVTLPVQSLDAGTYEFRMNVRDCAGQWGNSGPKFFKFKVEPPQ